MTGLLLALLLAVPTPPEINEAIRVYYRDFEHAATQRNPGQPTPNAQPPTPGPQRPAPGAPDPTLLAVIRPGTTTPITEASVDERLVLLGNNLPEDGTVVIAQREATVTRRTPTSYEIIAPAAPDPRDPRPLTGAVDLFVGSAWRGRLHGVEFTLSLKPPPEPEVFIRAKVTGTGSAQLKAGDVLQSGGLSLTLTEVRVGPAPDPVPAPLTNYPAFDGPLDESGNWVRDARPGQVVTLKGREFGTARGRVVFNEAEVPVVEWSDTAIRFSLPPLPAIPRPWPLIHVFRPDGSPVAHLGFNLYR